jgi:uncharacterized protein (DUF3820 family)
MHCPWSERCSVMSSHMMPDKAYFLKLAHTRMPFGRYEGTVLIDLPESYVVWFAQKGFPPGALGDMLRSIYEIKLNGLEYLFDPLRNMSKPSS